MTNHVILLHTFSNDFVLALTSEFIEMLDQKKSSLRYFISSKLYTEYIVMKFSTNLTWKLKVFLKSLFLKNVPFLRQHKTSSGSSQDVLGRFWRHFENIYIQGTSWRYPQSIIFRTLLGQSESIVRSFSEQSQKVIFKIF